MTTITARIAFSLCLAMFLAGCAETPDGTIIVNEQTIENFLDDGKGGLKAYNPPSNLNLVMDQPVVNADIPRLPQGQLRLAGTLDSAGPYKVEVNGNLVQRGSTFSHSVYGMLGPAGEGGNAWFYADFNSLGEITAARAYLYGFNGGVCDLRQPANGSYGTLGPTGFAITLDGLCYFPSQSGVTYEYALLIAGDKTPLGAARDWRAKVSYVIDNNGAFASIPQRPRSNPQIYDYGSGTATLQK